MNASKFILLAGLFAFITAELIPAQDTPTPTATAADHLNTEIPATTRVTIRSEIERGMSAAPSTTDFSVLHYDEAVTAVKNQNRQKNTYSLPFQFGLNYAVWHDLWVSLSIGIYRNPADRKYAEEAAQFYSVLTMPLQQILRLSDDDVRNVASARYVDNENAIFREIVKTKKFKGSYAIHFPPPKNRR